MRLRELREREGKAIGAFAKELGISKSYLSMLETGASKASIRVALKLEHRFKGVVRAETLVSDDDRQLLERLPPASPGEGGRIARRAEAAPAAGAGAEA